MRDPLIEKIEELMQSWKIKNLRELSIKAEIPYTTLKGLYTRNTDNIQRSTLVKLATFFQCTVAYLADDNIKVNDDRFKYPQHELQENKAVPVLGIIPAGIPIEAIQDILDYEYIKLDPHKEYFALKVSGDSMLPKYADGDVVIFTKQPDCNSR